MSKQILKGDSLIEKQIEDIYKYQKWVKQHRRRAFRKLVAKLRRQKSSFQSTNQDDSSTSN